MSAFHTTRWSLVLGAKGDEPHARAALAELCEAYWLPVYVYVRREHNEHDGRDLTQAFFLHLLERRDFERADQQRGKFRTFLLTCLQNFLRNHARDQKALKRGGGKPSFTLDWNSIDWDAAEQSIEPIDTQTPEWHFDRAYAQALLTRVATQLQQEYEAAGRGHRFAALQAAITPGETLPPYKELADQLDTTEGSIKVFVHQLRQRFGEMLRTEVRDTAGEGDGDTESELARLLALVTPPHS